MAMCVMSCGDDATVNPPTDNNLSGTIAGRVVLFDEYGDSLTNHSGVAVKLVNENKSYSATTDASGNYRLEKVIAGIYTLSLEKEGWNTQKEEQLQFVGNGTLQSNYYLGKNRKSILQGSVRLRSQYVNDTLDHSGINISIDGTTLSAVSNKYGNWIIKGMQEGEFTVTATKAGYLQTSKRTFSFYNDTTSGSPRYLDSGLILYEIPTAQVTLFQPEENESQVNGFHKEILLNGEFINAKTGKKPSIKLFFYDNESVSKENSFFNGYPNSGTVSLAKWIFWADKNGYPDEGPQSEKIRQKFPSGARVYVRAYVTSGELYGPPSNIVSFTMP
jgi:hypothetical protein